MNKEKLLNRLLEQYEYHQGEADKYEKGGVKEPQKHYQTVANVYYKVYQEVKDGECDN